MIKFKLRVGMLIYADPTIVYRVSKIEQEVFHIECVNTGKQTWDKLENLIYYVELKIS